ncbi:PEP-CTERM sorting domain-containing protein [Viridibacterium curvum]|uniref:Ice-binding protein C-terminal domain-containing protein n=1 Tax=Viridibacterium curvum TaxID=1101404 RepID=A0ABP9QKW8_9RHOO
MNDRKILGATLCALMIVGSSSVVAAPANGNFSGGLTGWEAAGDVAVLGSTAFAQLTTATLGGDDLPAAAGAFNVSGNAAAASGGLESFLGLSAGALDPDAAGFVFASEGSAIRQTVTVSAGDTLSFEWNFLSNEAGFAAQPDYAFVVIGGNLIRLADSAGSLSPSAVYGGETGTRHFSYTFTSGGSVVLGFGVVDAVDGSVSSALTLDAVQISPVPEPTAVAMFLAGLGIAGFAARRQKR